MIVPDSNSFAERPLDTACVMPASRRLFLNVAAVAVGALAVSVPTGSAMAQGTGYEVLPWSGPISSFSLVDLDGKNWQLADLKGRAVLLNFWATWCPPCRAEMPALQQVADLHGADKLLVLAINFKEPASRAKRFVQESRLTLPVLLDLDGKSAAQWGVRIFPTTLLIDSAGRPQQRVKGEMEWTGPVAGKLIDALFVKS